jgi:hypothetical protein
MRDDKERPRDDLKINKVQNEEKLEISQTGYGLESVANGTDYMEGDQNNPPDFGGL